MGGQLHWIYWPIIILFGAVMGSFLNVVIYRGPTLWGLVGEDRKARGTLLSPRSHCPQCKKPIPIWRLIPIVSFLVQGGKCAECREPISLRYPLIEGLGALAAVIAVIVFGLTMHAAMFAVFSCVLITLAATDWETGFLPDWLTLPLIILGLAANANGLFVSIENALLGAGIGYSIFTLIGFTFRKLRGVDGLGQGDAKLLAAIGAWAGVMVLPFVVLIGTTTTLLAVLFTRHGPRKTNRSTPIPLGPGLCFAGFLVFLIL